MTICFEHKELPAPVDFDPEDNWFCRYIEGPRKWSTSLRKAWVLTILVSWVVWPLPVLFIFFMMPLILLVCWLRSVWRNEECPQLWGDY